MLQPAGYRPAGAWVRAGAGLRGAGGSVGMSCVRFALVLRFWRGVLCSIYARRAFLGMFCVHSRLLCGSGAASRVRPVPVIRFLLECLLRLIYACRAALSECLVFVHACCLTRCAKQDGLREAAFLFRRGSRSPVVRSQWPCGYRALWVHFGLARFFMAIPTENERDAGDGVGGAAECVFA